MKELNTENGRLKKIVKIIDSLIENNGRLIKESIIKDNDNEFLRDIFYFVYNPYIITGLSEKKLNKDVDNIKIDQKIETFYQLLEYLRNNNTGKDENIYVVQQYLQSKSYLIKQLLEQIVTKNLKIGITSKTLNKIYGSAFIPNFEVMLAKNYNDHKEKVEGKSFTLTEKLNGMRCILIKDDGKITCFSRQGHVVEDLIDIENEAVSLPNNLVYDGELISENLDDLNSEDLFRKTVSISRKIGIKKNLIFNVFDMIGIDDFKKGKGSLPYKDRKKFLNTMNLKYIKHVPFLYVGNDIDEIDKILHKVILEGKEGLMLNIDDAFYECKRTTNVLKVIKYNSVDVRVLSLMEGTNKNKNKLGSIVFEFSYNGKIYNSECGSGFTDEERELYWKSPELLKDKIVIITYKGISRDKKGVYSIRNSSWKSIIRHDKTEISMY